MSKERLKAILRQWMFSNHHLGRLSQRLYSSVAQLSFRSSVDYWERRYQRGGTSGAGSYNRLAEFKAEFLNLFVEEHHIRSIVEFGCGDGAQLSLARYPDYLGIDVSPTAITMCKKRFANDPSKRFKLADSTPVIGDLALSLDVIYHLVEDAVFEAYMHALFAAAGRYVIVYSSNLLEDVPDPHVKHRKFTDWIAANCPQWLLAQYTQNPYPYTPTDPNTTSFADFYVFARVVTASDAGS